MHQIWACKGGGDVNTQIMLRDWRVSITIQKSWECRVHEPEGNEVLPACQNKDTLKGYLPACVHSSLDHAQSWKCYECAPRFFWRCWRFHSLFMSLEMYIFWLYVSRANLTVRVRVRPRYCGRRYCMKPMQPAYYAQCKVFGCKDFVLSPTNQCVDSTWLLYTSCKADSSISNAHLNSLGYCERF